jgi:hypothetical protein
MNKITELALPLVMVLFSCPEVGVQPDFSLGPRNSYFDQYYGPVWDEVTWVNTSDEESYLMLDVNNVSNVSPDSEIEAARFYCKKDVTVRVNLEYQTVAPGAGFVHLLELTGRDFTAIVTPVEDNYDFLASAKTNDSVSQNLRFIAGNTYVVFATSGFGSNKNFSASLEMIP